MKPPRVRCLRRSRPSVPKRTKTPAKSSLVRAGVQRDKDTNRLRIAFVVDTRPGGFSSDGGEQWVVDLETSRSTDLAGLWPVSVKTKIIIKMYAKLNGGKFNQLRREMVMAQLRNKNLITV